MSLTTVPIQNSVSLFNVSAPVSALSYPAIEENVPSCRNIFSTEKEVSVKTELFVQTLYQNLLSGDKTLKISPLRKIFNRMIQGHDQTIKQALKKPNGYLYRLFSNESWEEWIEQKTALGKVTSIFVDYVESEFPFKDLPSYLDFEMLLKANAQAENLLKQLSESSKLEAKAPLDNPQEDILKDSDCSVGLALGAVGALATQNPIPLGIASLNCVAVVNAQGAAAKVNAHKAQTIKNLNQHKPHGTSNTAGTTALTQNPNIYDNRAEQIRMEMFGELQSTIPDNLINEFQTKTGWVDYIVLGLEIFLNTISVTTPMNVFKDQMALMNQRYWTNTVAAEYYDIFPNLPQMCCDLPACYDGEIQGMRSKLRSHGYDVRMHGTPLQFVRLLKSRGVCERGVCT